MDLAQRLVPDDVELGFFFFEPVELAEGGVNVCPFRQQHLIAQHRFEDRQVAVPFGAKALAGAGLGQAGDGADLPGPMPSASAYFAPEYSRSWFAFSAHGSLSVSPVS